MPDIETIVIGAGVVGLAVAARLSQSGQEVIVLEREAAIGQGISSRNSEVIHAGIYYPKNSLKADLCVQGRSKLYQYCDERSIAAKRIGKFIVATEHAEVAALKQLEQSGIQNGVDDLQLLSGDDARTMQPGLRCVAALHSPSTGIVDSHSLMISLQGDIELLGGAVVCHSEVGTVHCADNLFTLTLTDGTQVTTTRLINSCGLNAIPLANQFRSFEMNTLPNALFAKGNYFKCTGGAPFSKLIYPAPVPGGLGIHLTIDLDGQKRFGPDVEWLKDPIQKNLLQAFNFKVDPSRADNFYNAIRRYWPDLPDNALVPDYAGVRPKIKSPGTANVDFQISTDQHHGVKGLVNLFGIESPGLTACLAIASLVASQL